MAVAAPQSEARQPIEHVTRVGKAVGDALRANILLTLREDSFSVSELCTMLDVPQPALSHHLKVLHGAGLVARRREGTSIFYRREVDGGDPLKQTIFATLDESEPTRRVRSAMARIHSERRARSLDFFASHAEEIADLHKDIAEPGAYVEALLTMAKALEPARRQRALEVGPGDASLLRGLAGSFEEVLGVDSSAEMLARARSAERLRNVTLEHEDFFTMASTAHFDLVAAAMVVHHLPSPPAFFQQATRLLRPGGSLLIAELTRHEQRWASEHCGDQWLGFEPAELKRWAELAGLAATESQFLAQKNGFQIQLQRYEAPAALDTTRQHTQATKDPS